MFVLPRNRKRKVYFGLYVDDNLLIGDPPAIQETIQELKEKGLVLKVDDNLNNHSSCDIRFSEEKNRAWIGQPHLIANLQDKFGDKVSKLRNYVTPGSPSLSIVRNPLQEVLILQEDHKLYRSGSGMLLYLVKSSRPDIANPVRELLKLLDAPTSASFKEMLRVIKYVLDTKEYGLRVHPNKKRINVGNWYVSAIPITQEIQTHAKCNGVCSLREGSTRVLEVKGSAQCNTVKH